MSQFWPALDMFGAWKPRTWHCGAGKLGIEKEKSMVRFIKAFPNRGEHFPEYSAQGPRLDCKKVITDVWRSFDFSLSIKCSHFVHMLMVRIMYWKPRKMGYNM